MKLLQLILVSLFITFSQALTTVEYLQCINNITENCDQTCHDLIEQTCDSLHSELQQQDENCKYATNNYPGNTTWPQEYSTSVNKCIGKCVESLTGDAKAYRQKFQECVPDPNASPALNNTLAGINQCANNSTAFETCDESCLSDKISVKCDAVIKEESCTHMVKYLKEKDHQQELTQYKLEQMDTCYSDCEKLIEEEIPKKSIQAYRLCIQRGQEDKDTNTALILNSIFSSILLIYFMIII